MRNVGRLLGSESEPSECDRVSTGAEHQIIVCISCREPKATPEGGDESLIRGQQQTSAIPQSRDAGLRLAKRLRSALNSNGMLEHAGSRCATFEVKEVACMAGCSRPCTVGYVAPGKATYLFGDIDPDSSMEPLVAFADQYVGLDDGWCSSTERPIGLSGKTLARVPAFLSEPLEQRAESA